MDWSSCKPTGTEPVLDRIEAINAQDLHIIGALEITAPLPIQTFFLPCSLKSTHDHVQIHSHHLRVHYAIKALANMPEFDCRWSWKSHRPICPFSYPTFKESRCWYREWETSSPSCTSSTNRFPSRSSLPSFLRHVSQMLSTRASTYTRPPKWW